MTDAAMLMMGSSAALLGVGIASAATLRAWTGWLELKRLELEVGTRGRGRGKPVVAELKERVRKLEAIASGIEI